MSRSTRAVLALATVTLCLFNVAAPATASSLIHLDTGPAWRHAAGLGELTEVLERWLDANSDYPRRADRADIRLTDQATAASIAGTASRAHSTRRGLYDAETAMIFLVQPWSAKRARDVSVLLHELVHHRQTVARFWYCPGAQETDAYDLQEQWLAERGLTIDINRIAVVLEAGCTSRDIHPD